MSCLTAVKELKNLLLHVSIRSRDMKVTSEFEEKVLYLSTIISTFLLNVAEEQ